MSETLHKQIQNACNSVCREENSNTPDFILARYLMDCLYAFENATNARSNWYGNVTGTSRSFDVRDKEVL